MIQKTYQRPQFEPEISTSEPIDVESCEEKPAAAVQAATQKREKARTGKTRAHNPGRFLTDLHASVSLVRSISPSTASAALRRIACR